jgi:histidinol dehydrogenase
MKLDNPRTAGLSKAQGNTLSAQTELRNTLSASQCARDVMVDRSYGPASQGVPQCAPPREDPIPDKLLVIEKRLDDLVQRLARAENVFIGPRPEETSCGINAGINAVGSIVGSLARISSMLDSANILLCNIEGQLGI